MSEHYGAARIRTSIVHYLVGKTTSSIAGFLALILLARSLSVEAFADYSVLVALVEVLTALSGFGLVHAVLRFIPELYGNHRYQSLWRFTLGTLAIRTVLLLFVAWVAYLLTGRVVGAVGLDGAENAYVAFLVVVVLRSSAHFVSQVLESTLSQGLSQAGFTVSSLARLIGMVYLVSTGDVSLLDVIWMEAITDALGLTVLCMGLIYMLKEHLGAAPTATDDSGWIGRNQSRIIRFSLAGYIQHMLILPYGGHTNRLLGGHFLSAAPMAAFGFAQSLYEYAKRYLPAQLLIGVIRPAVVARYSESGDFGAANRTVELIFRINAILVGAAIAYIPVAGSETINVLTGGKYGSETVGLLMALIIMLLLETFRQQLEVLAQAVERYEHLIGGNIILSMSVLPAVVALPFLGALAFPLCNSLGLLLSNAWVVRKLAKHGHFYKHDWRSSFRVAGFTGCGLICGWGALYISKEWWFGGLFSIGGYLSVVVTFERAGLRDLYTLIKGKKPLPANVPNVDSQSVPIAQAPFAPNAPSLADVRFPHGLNKYTSAIYHQLFLDFGQRKDAVLVVGTGRSGTTWVGDVIAAATHSRILFEPFVLRQDGHFLHLNQFTFGNPQGYLNRSIYLNGNEPDLDSYKTQIDSIFGGRIRSPWIDQEVQPGIYGRRLIKDIRANLMLAFMARTWPGLKICFIIRNPVMVIDSMMAKNKDGWMFDWMPSHALDQPRLMQDWLNPFQKDIERGETQVERLALRWCVENYIPLQQIQDLNNVLTIRYEDLVSDIKLWDKVAAHVGYDNWDSNKVLEYVGKPSHTSSLSLHSRESPRCLQPNEIDAIRSVVERFGLGQYLH